MTLASACIKRKMALSPSSPRFSFWKEERTENERIAWKFIFFFLLFPFRKKEKGEMQNPFPSYLYARFRSLLPQKRPRKEASEFFQISALSMKEKNWKKCFWIRIFCSFFKNGDHSHLPLPFSPSILKRKKWAERVKVPLSFYFLFLFF